MLIEREGKMRTGREYTFENFKQCAGNLEAYEVLYSLGENADKKEDGVKGGKGRILWLKGTSGTGKTHLLYALQHALRQNGEKRARQISCETLLKEIIKMWEWDLYEDMAEDYIARFCREEMLFIEDVDYCLRGKDSCQKEISCLIERLVNHHGKQVIITSHELLEPFYTMVTKRVKEIRMISMTKYEQK